ETNVIEIKPPQEIDSAKPEKEKSKEQDKEQSLNKEQSQNKEQDVNINLEDWEQEKLKKLNNWQNQEFMIGDLLNLNKKILSKNKGSELKEDSEDSQMIHMLSTKNNSPTTSVRSVEIEEISDLSDQSENENKNID